MTKEEILKKVKEFFDTEYEETKEYLERQPRTLAEKRESTANAQQRCLGVAFFVQSLEISYDDINPPFEEVADKLYELLY